MRHVLLLHQEGVTRPVRAKFDAAFVDALQASEGPLTEVYEEALDPERFSGNAQWRLVRDYLANKYADRQIDAVVAVGDQALGFARDIRDMFGNPPIVAVVSPRGGIDVEDGVTGLRGGGWIGGTIDLALALRPDTQNVYVVDGAHGNPGELESEIRRQLSERRKVNLVYLRDLPLNDLIPRIAAVPEHSIVLFVRQTIRDQHQSLDPIEGLSQVAKASPAPIFGQMEEYLGSGVVGGYMWQSERDAVRVAGMVTRILNGESLFSIAPGPSTFTPEVDWRQLRRWGISDKLLPPGTVTLFYQPTFFDQYGAYVAAGLIVMAAQLGLIAALLTQRVRRRRAEERTRTSDARYKSVVETQSELICRFLPDTTLTFVNDAFCRFWNKRRDELLGTRFIDLVPPLARAAVLERIGRLSAGADSHEHPVVMPDGSVGWQHWVNQALLDEQGDVVEFQGVGRDITDRKAAEAALVKVEARNTAMLRAIPDVMFVLRHDGTFVDFHARDRRLLLVPPEVFLGRTIRDVMPPHLGDKFMDALEEASANGGPVVVEYELDLEEPRHFEARLVSAGHDTVLSIVRDVSDSKRAAELNRDLAGRLIASQEAERQRVARELHDDLSQKIAMLNIEIDQITARMKPGGHRTALERISVRAGEIASDMHNLSHELHPSKLQALGLVAAIQALCRDITQRRGIAVSFTHEALLEPIDMNVSLCLYRVTQEALHNVARHSKARDAAVTLTCDETNVYLQISDSGVGFAPSAPGRGGLGLVSMRERVGFLKGDLVINAPAGRGCRIGVRIPRANAARAETVTSRTA